MHCQKCRTPLKLDGSLEDLNPAAYDLLVGTASQNQSKQLPPSRPSYPQERKAPQNAPSPTFKRTIGGSSGTRNTPKDNSTMSFVMLTESQVVPPSSTSSHPPNQKASTRQRGNSGSFADDAQTQSMSHEMERITRLFEILSARSDIDHPICIECTELLIDGLQKRLDASVRERDAYVGFLKQVNASQPTEDEIKQSEEALAAAQRAEQEAMDELLRLEKEKADADAEIAKLEEESRELDKEEEQFWRSRNAFASKLVEFQNERDSVNLKYDHDSQQLEKLQRTNIYNDTFCISHDGKFGTINGLRLGRLSNVPVDWPEINAAWGHTLLLLATVADRLGFKFDGYELQPMGSTSRIIKLEYPAGNTSRSGSTPREPARKVLELYSSGDMILGLTFMHGKFDRAMVAFLECLRQVGVFVENETAKRSGGESERGSGGSDRERGARGGLNLPYKIKGEFIGEVSIKLGLQQDDTWSKACKYTLTCCKFLLAHASNVNTNGRR